MRLYVVAAVTTGRMKTSNGALACSEQVNADDGEAVAESSDNN